ncbi:MAG: type I secretion C-terminal target domain-containing protein [Rhodospirillales bacterium]|nr:type I secretion C-terminal target domain-containing protein [Rhodospirillales bacterium]
MPNLTGSDGVKALAAGVDVPGTPADDTIAGDVLRTVGTAVSLDAEAGNANGTVDGADGEDIVAFDDTLFAGGGEDTLAGDVVSSGGGDVALAVGVGESGKGFYRPTPNFPFYEYATGGLGGDDNRCTAFNDRVGAGLGADRLAGDVLAIGGDVELAVSVGQAESGADGGNFNRASAFNDTLGAGDGDDIVAGDVLTTGTGALRLALQVGRGNPTGSRYGDSRANGGDYGIATAFGDDVHGDVGADQLAGDVFRADASGTVILEAQVGEGGNGNINAGGGHGGSMNGATAFDDSLFGEAGSDVLAGDVISDRSTGRVSLLAGAGSGGDVSSGGARDALHAFEDSVRGGASDDVLAGDVVLRDGVQDLLIQAEAGEQGDGPPASGGNQCAVFAFDDSLFGASGRDTMAGDVLLQHLVGSVTLSALCGTATADSNYGGNGGDRNVLTGFNDILTGGGSADLLVGDVYSVDVTGDLHLRAASGTASYNTVGGGSNLAQAFNDRLIGGLGGDTLIGDAALAGILDTSGSTVLIADAGSGGSGSPHAVNGEIIGYGGDGGDANETHAFSDTLFGDAGSDLLVGDVQATPLDGTMSLNVLAGVAPENSDGEQKNAGDLNVSQAFNDAMEDFGGAGILIGDIDLTDGAGSVTLRAAAGAGSSRSDFSGGEGGDDNSVRAFCDSIFPSADDGDIGNLLVGDVRSQAFTGSIGLVIEAGTDGLGGDGGDGNGVTAFNDLLIVQPRNDVVDDLLIGDVYFASSAPSLSITIAGEAGNSISAFQDSLSGGGGNDALWGDFFNGSGGFLPSTLHIEGDFAGREHLFADTIDGGNGNDTLAGGLGSDVLTGGSGADHFVWDEGDLTRIAITGTVPVDRVTDFGATDHDVLDFSGLLASLGFTAGDSASDWLSLRSEAGATVIAIDADGTGVDETFSAAVRLEGFTTALPLQQLIDDGTILIA